MVPPHTPALVVPTHSVVEPRQDDESPAIPLVKYSALGRGRNSSVRGELYLYLLDYDRVTIESLDSVQPLDFSNPGVDPSNPIPTSDDDERQLRWIPRLGQANAASDLQELQLGDFDLERFLSSDLVPVAEGHLSLAGSLLMDRGTLFVDGVQRVASGDPLRYQFARLNDYQTVWEQAQYESVRWEAPFSDEQLIITLSSGDQGRERTLRLQPQDGLLDLKIANLELESLLGISNATPTALSTNADIDFATMYLYSRSLSPPAQAEPSASAGRELPVPIPSEPGGATRRCMGSQFNMMNLGN